MVEKNCFTFFFFVIFQDSPQSRTNHEYQMLQGVWQTFVVVCLGGNDNVRRRHGTLQWSKSDTKPAFRMLVDLDMNVQLGHENPRNQLELFEFGE